MDQCATAENRFVSLSRTGSSDEVNATTIKTRLDGETVARQPEVPPGSKNKCADSCGESRSRPLVGERNAWAVAMPRKKRKSLLNANRLGKADINEDVKFRASIMMVPLFISNVSKEVTESDIISYIKDKTQEEVKLYKINRQIEKRYNSFKLYVSKRNLNLFLEDSFWPSGISYRRFVHDKYIKKKGTHELKPSSQQYGSV